MGRIGKGLVVLLIAGAAAFALLGLAVGWALWQGGTLEPQAWVQIDGETIEFAHLGLGGALLALAGLLVAGLVLLLVLPGALLLVVGVALLPLLLAAGALTLALGLALLPLWLPLAIAGWWWRRQRPRSAAQ